MVFTLFNFLITKTLKILVYNQNVFSFTFGHKNFVFKSEVVYSGIILDLD